LEKEFEKETREIQDKVMKYVHDSLEGNIVQGQSMLWSMERFLKDLKRTNDPNNKYYFDWYELMKFNRWCLSAKHSKGVLAGKPVEPHVSWLFEFANILCFKERNTGYRRFREAFIFQARKQGKTQKVALLASYIAFLSEEQEEVYIAGWSRDQSMLAYNEILFQIERMPMLNGRYSDSYNHVKVRGNGSTIKALSREAKRFGDGTAPSVAIIDEYANSHETNEIVDVLKSGMIARKAPLTVYITTSGFNLDYPAYDYYTYCKSIIDPNNDTENDDIFVAIYELDKDDDIKDENVWAKSNPVATTYEEGIKSIRSELKLALDQPSKMRNFLTKNLNVWVDQKEDGYIELSKWNKAEVDVSEVPSFLEGANLYVGLDLSLSVDLTSIGWVAVKEGKFMVGQHSFMPSGKFKERMSRDKVRFDIFEQRGELTQTPGDVVDYHYVRQWVVDFCAKHNVIQIGYDKWNASMLAQGLLNDGYPMVEIPQSLTQLSEPTKRFREYLYDDKIMHADDKLLKWAISNAVLKSDQQENVMIGKQVSRDRIDPIAAVINAFARAMYDEYVVDLNNYFLSDDFRF
jgi:phage terminase large subunit-like protein